MIVDTSLVQRDEQSKVRELRSLPLEATSLSRPTDTSILQTVDAIVDGGECVDFSDCANSNLNISIPRTSGSIVSVENHVIKLWCWKHGFRQDVK
ncbi:Arginine-glutamic acid dipeptide repeat [Gossypium australe]|uniref:Arginine-glutamic acid dipeptide repeat n=1 Tax=Gossypium australe TaxID=47621 RepID=A0A5B6W1G9_9ROSI|nr:Arginine-glutamic acid dipeptide repeat [Gossypium australe]